MQYLDFLNVEELDFKVYKLSGLYLGGYVIYEGGGRIRIKNFFLIIKYL
jgi:hypothetical protein